MILSQSFRRISGVGYITALLLTAAYSVPAQPVFAKAVAHSSRPLTLYIVCHAEKLNDRADSPLTSRGKTYARRLGFLLRNRGITCILTSSLKRARDTARPLAQRLRAKGRPYRWGTLSSDNPRAIEGMLNRITDGGAVLLVGRSNFVPELVQDLTGTNVQPDRNLYYEIYRLVRQRSGTKPFTLVRGTVWGPIVRRTPTMTSTGAGSIGGSGRM